MSRSGLKILMVVLVCLAVGGIAVIAAGYYAVHKIKQTVVAKAETYGVDLKSIPSPIPSSRSSRRKVYKPCAILPKDEASELLGETIERTAMVEEACVYFGPPGLAEKLARQETRKMMAGAQAGAQINPGDMADTVTKMMGAVAAQSGQNGADGAGTTAGEAPLLTFAVDPDGKPQMFAVAATKGIFGGITSANGAPGLGAEIPNLGDRAIRLGPLGLNVLKGDTVIRIVVGPIPDANSKSIVIARKVLPRI
ncbi:MAG TPA: hypothetical protein VFW44_14850 [Bryobacteraceae bacterium]|nr:hypothetical protein [Bryobacteraceae bacterium]